MSEGYASSSTEKFVLPKVCVKQFYEGFIFSVERLSMGPSDQIVYNAFHHDLAHSLSVCRVDQLSDT
jgi:hypothetical protein